MYGLYTWRADGRYSRETPHKVYKVLKVAEKAAAKHYLDKPSDNWVCRLCP